MSSINFQPILSSDYPGYEEFASKVLRPIFNTYYQPLPADDILYSYGNNNPMAEKAHIRSIIHKATISPTDGYANFDPIEVYDITMDDNCRLAQCRVGIQQYIRSVNFQSSHAFLVFHYGKSENRSWRFSYFYKKQTIASATDSKRYTYLFGQGVSARTANERFNELLKIASANREQALLQIENNVHVFTNEDITDAFSVETLSDEFFHKYLGYYASFVKYLTGKPTAKESGKYAIKDAAFRKIVADMDKLGLKDNDDQFHQSFLSRFKSEEECEKAIRDYVKKMMGRVVFLHFLQKKGWMCGDRDFMYHLFENSSLKNDFLDRVLEPLFFVILNTHPDDRLDVCRKHNNNMKWERGKSVEWDENLVESWRDIPYLNGGLFEREEIDKCRSIFPAEYFEKFLDFFRQYNFTIDENDPNDMEVGVDPEMLSKIFENLLEDNKEKGAFYTPKEIVRYMCSESLISYLKQQCGGDDWNEEMIRRFVSDPLADGHFTVNQQQALIDALVRVKVCDPAIGSGAFPMGMLNLIAHCRHALESTPMFEIKRHIIQHNIFGVDIEQGAVDIARLRFWLSLVVDETEPHALPNLDYRIVRGNSLLTTFCGEYLDLSEMKDGRTRLAKMRQQLATMQDEYYSLNGEAKWKKEVEIKNLLLDCIEMQIKGEAQDSDNIRYTQLNIDSERTLKISKKDIAAAKRLFQNRLLHSRNLKNIRTKLNSFHSNFSERAHTDIDFFDWEIMFSNVFAEDGFDIVIGNPPYLRIQGIRKDNPEFANFLVDSFKAATGRFDLYVAFIEKGYQLCCKHGLLNFIMPTKWTNSDYGLGMRSFIIKEKPYIKMVNFSSFQVFNASTYTGIQWFVKDANSNMDYVQLSRNVITPNELDNFLKNLNQKDFTSYNYLDFSSMPWKLSSSQSSSDIISKISKLPKLKTILKYISQGTVTVGDDIFVMEGYFEEDNFIGYSEEINKEVCLEAQLMKPLLKGEDVKRYSELKNNYYILYPHHQISGKTIPYTEEEMQSLFPKAYAYLLPFKDKLIEKKIKYKTNPAYWYSLHRSRDIVMFEGKKILTPEISLGCNMSLDESGFYHNTQNYTLLPKQAYEPHIYILLGILNSKLFWFYIANTGSILRGGFFRFKTKYIEGFSIPNLVSLSEKKIASIEAHVKQILKAKRVNLSVDTSNEEQEIDRLVYHLYNLTYDEVKIVDPNTPITEEDYDKKD